VSREHTLPRRLVELAAARPDEIALQEKRYGIWHPTPWTAYAARVRDFAGGLATLGVGRGDAVGVLGDNRPEWLIAELAAHCLGAAVVGLDPASAGDQVAALLELAAVRVVVAEDQEQVDKLAELRARLPRLARVVYYDPHGLERRSREDQDDRQEREALERRSREDQDDRQEREALERRRDDYLARFTDVEAAGRRDGAERPGWLDGEIAAGAASDVALLCAAPDGTGLARLSHADLWTMAERLHRIDPLAPGRRHVSFQPLASIGEQLVAVACGLAHGLLVAFPEDAATQDADLREIGPDVMLAPPAFWDRVRGSVRTRAGDADWLKRRAFAWAYRVGEAVAERRARGRAPGAALAAAHRMAGALALGAVRDHLGLSRLRRGYADGALAPEVVRFFDAIGVPLTAVDLGELVAAREAAR
jgi:long-chain acyl-CoA synthetase